MKESTKQLVITDEKNTGITKIFGVENNTEWLSGQDKVVNEILCLLADYNFTASGANDTLDRVKEEVLKHAILFKRNEV
ncbi:hypothetical protein D3C74_347750 [compost metagenome]